MSTVKAGGVDGLITQLGDMLSRMELCFGIDSSEALGGRVRDLVEHAAADFGRRVLVLEDKHDVLP